MSADSTLTIELRTEVLRLEDDLRARVMSQYAVQQTWRTEYDAARAAERTAAAWESWVDERVTLAAVAWVLTTVFIRFCEDNALVKPVWISGPRGREALEAQQQFLRETARTNPDVTDREWLLQAINHLKSLPATTGLVDATSAMWLVTPSGDAVTRLFNYWRERDERGGLLRDLSGGNLDTRFLGDLYQEVSQDAKKRYALLQTPVFVEEFILDRTLEPALNERPLEGFKMIDPTCGSGHFLLGGFQRLLDRWHKHAPGLDERERVQAALGSVYGVDLNPFAVAIARFRLTLAAVQACDMNSIEYAPAFKYHLAVGDSLLHGFDQQEFDFGARLSADRVAANFTFATENLSDLHGILRNGQYDAVVGNPPYIQAQDSSLNGLYRKLYPSCKGTYALSVPFMERFFLLARSPGPAGWVGQITSNSFMKRNFGTRLIEEFMPRVELIAVIDSEGAWIPGHNMDGTPTVILIGQNQRPSRSSVRTVLSKGARESRSVGSEGAGPYWRSIVEHLDNPGFDNNWITVADLERDAFRSHPWSLTGGGAIELKEAIGKAPDRLGQLPADIGFGVVTRQDAAYMLGAGALRRSQIPTMHQRLMIEGENARDFLVSEAKLSLFPYHEKSLQPESDPALERLLWPYRHVLANRVAYGLTQIERKLAWFEYSMFFSRRYARSIRYIVPSIATHNHFVLDRSSSIHKDTAFLVNLHPRIPEEKYMELLPILNSSVVCFWLRQQSKPKGGAADQLWARTHQFTATILKSIPLPRAGLGHLGARLDKEAQRAQYSIDRLNNLDQPPTRSALGDLKAQFSASFEAMVALQEEGDWATYRAYGLIDEDYTYLGEDLPRVRPGERAFEIALARHINLGNSDFQWFARNDIQPVTEIPKDWPSHYQTLVANRLEIIESRHHYLQLLEAPEHKRRWMREPWPDLQKKAIGRWLLRQLEQNLLWVDTNGRPTPKNLTVLSDDVGRDRHFAEALTLWEGRPDIPVVESLGTLIQSEAVPFLMAHVFKDSGRRNRAAWENVWKLQRQAAAGVPVSISTPREFNAADYLRQEYWLNRGKLDVPQEGFILYPGAGREGDPTPVLGWRGWDHAQQALALATLIQTGEQQGWHDDRLLPLVAGIAELLPWVEQWHSEPDALYGGSSPAEFFTGLLDSYMAKLGATRESLAQWRPPAPKRGKKKA
jgi:hypothetical protein